MKSELGPELAKAHLSRARNALELGDQTAAVLWSNLCAEVALEVIATSRGIDSRKEHFRRASIARRLFEMGAIGEDLGDLLIRLNNERKHATYEGLPPDLRGRSWESVFDSLAELVNVAFLPSGQPAPDATLEKGASGSSASGAQ